MGTKIAIIGTSNSILKGGYSYGLREHPGIERVDSLALGASTTVLLAKLMVEKDLSDYDYVLFDFSVNEDFLLQAGSISVEDVRDRVIEFIATKINPETTLPVIVILPMADGVNRRRPFAEFYRNLAEERGYPCFSGLDYLTAKGYANRELPPLFQDMAHLKPEHAYGFGSSIAEGILHLDRTKFVRETLTEEVRSSYYLKLNPENWPHLEFVNRETSIDKDRFARIKSDGKFGFTFDVEAQMTGVEMNLSQTNADVTITASGHIRKEPLKTAHYRGDGTHLCHVISPISPISSKSFEISFADSDTPHALAEIAGFTFFGEKVTVNSPVWREGQ